MITRLQGQLVEKLPPFVVLDVQGVGYEIALPLSCFEALPAVGELCCLHTHLSIKDDAHVLYGFNHPQERHVFRALLKANGVGPKMALAILSTLTLSQVLTCIQTQDLAALTQVPGVGKKTAERLVVELKDKLTALTLPLAASTAGGVDSAAILRDAQTALVALGYKSSQAQERVQSVTPIESVEQVIRAALAVTGV